MAASIRFIHLLVSGHHSRDARLNPWSGTSLSGVRDGALHSVIRPRLRRLLSPALAIVVVGIMLATGFVGNANGLVGSSITAATAPHSPPSAPSAPSAPAGTVPGTHPQGQPSLDAAGLAAANAVRWEHIRANSSAHNNSSATSGAGASGASAPVKPVQTGWFVGYVNNSSSAQGIQGVTVQAFTKGTNNCPPTTCVPVVTNPSGYFRVVAPDGPDYVTLQLTGWLENVSYAAASTGITIDLGTLYLVHMAIAYGVVRGDTATQPALASVDVTSASRDTVANGVNGATTGNGHFRVYIPPMPDEVSFTLPYNWVSNFTFVNATPYAQVNLGTILLEPEILYVAHIYDQLTGRPITTSLGSLTICAQSGSPLNGFCGTQGATTGGPLLYAKGPYGPVRADIQESGYVENITSVGWVSRADVGTTVYVGGGPFARVNLVPESSFLVRISVSHNATPLPAKWPLGQWVGSVCGLNGYFHIDLVMGPFGGTNTTPTRCEGIGCAPIGAFILPGLPLRDDIEIHPDFLGQCGGPPTWPIPGDLPVWGNERWANLTVGQTTSLGWLNLTPGTYVSGQTWLLAGGPPALPGPFTVTTQSTDDVALSAYSYISNGALSSPWDCGGIPASNAWCAPVPPGASKISVISVTFGTNYTWAMTSYRCCERSQEPLPLSGATLNHFTDVNFTTPVGAVTGTAIRADTGLGIHFGSLIVCAVRFPANCVASVVPDGGLFTVTNVSQGWDSITISASGFASNTVWANVTRGSTGLGTIPLTPLATLYGQVVNPAGLGIPDAVVHYCPVSDPIPCTSGTGGKVLGALGHSTTDGRYNGSVVGGWLPWTSYVIAASADGYGNDWAWVNATAGNYSVVPTLLLRPVVSGVPAAVRPTVGPAPVAGVWVDGRLVEGSTGYGILTGFITACPALVPGPCLSPTEGSNSGGFFNLSVPASVYTLYVNATGYDPVAIGFNASALKVLHLAALSINPRPTVTGRAVIAPVEWRLTTGPDGLGPGGQAQACDVAQRVCSTTAPLSTAGFFNLTLPIDAGYARVRILPGGTGTGTYTGGFLPANATFRILGPYNVLSNNSTIPVPLFGSVAGSVYGRNTTSGAPTVAAMGATVTVATSGGLLGTVTVTETANPEGTFAVFLPGGRNDNSTNVSVTLTGVYESGRAQLRGVVAAGTTLVAPPFTLVHFGWVQLRVVDPSSGLGVPAIGVTTSVSDPVTGIGYSANDVTDQVGFVNISSPRGSNVTVDVGPSLGYNSTSVVVARVNSSATSFPGGSGPLRLGVLFSAALGLVRSTSLNYSNASGAPDLPTVVDATNGRPIPLASVQVVSSDPLYSGTVGTTNWMGQFMVTAPIGLRDQLIVRATAFEGNTSHVFPIVAGEMLEFGRINLTATGVVAGRVIGYPGGLPVAGALLSVCPRGSSACGLSETNKSGLFWADAAPATDVVQVSANGYVTNSTTVALVCSDCFVPIAPITLYAYATVGGLVVGLPSGLPLAGANVSLCSPFGTPTGPCGVSARTSPTGSFELAAPFGPYVLAAAAPGFNGSYLPLSLSPGETVSVGVVFLSSFGTITGTVLSGLTFGPLPGALVYACPTWSYGNCTAATKTDIGGAFSVSGPPGPYLVTISAANYSSAFVAASVPSGGAVNIGTIVLSPLGPGGTYTVTGTVVTPGPTGALVPVAGAAVTALSGQVPVATVQTDATGSFSLALVWGVYTVLAQSPGYRPTSTAVTVHGPVYGVGLVVAIMTFPVSGTVRDGYTGASIADASVWEGATLLGTTGGDGLFLLQLANGTHEIRAVAPSSDTPYGPVPFQAVVNGAPQVHDVALFPPTETLYGVVADEVTGLGLPDASVTATGTAVDGFALAFAVTTDPAGHFVLELPAGEYAVTASAAQHAVKRLAVLASNGTAKLEARLTPQAGPATGASSPMSAWTFPLLIVGVAAAVAGLLVLWVRFTGGAARGRAPSGNVGAPSKPPGKH
ncbi:MAG: carboxypeptidase regulatory-like domain-containing protein [Thermoplasmata archaeon]|nr:carboxypeptidase regulatory-like domain-containing protein [Thermoplasmata archaeon]